MQFGRQRLRASVKSTDARKRFQFETSVAPTSTTPCRADAVVGDEAAATSYRALLILRAK